MNELEAFKSEINLTEFAATQGYVIDRKESSRSSIVMRREDGDKIIVARDRGDNHWVYFSVRDEKDNGSLIDFVQHRHSLNLGEVRKLLRPWIGKGSSPPRTPTRSYAQVVEPSSKNRARVVAEYSRMKPLRRHLYLEQERNIPAAVLSDPRFAGRIRIDSRGNAAFPHFDNGICGYELKNRGFTGFSKGGEKGLWLSVNKRDDTRLAFAESAIDALSYHVLHPGKQTRYASIGGQVNSKQPELIRTAATKMSGGSLIIAAMDADAEGRKLAELVRRAVELTGRRDLHFQVEEPDRGKDWNDRLGLESGV